MGDTSIQWTDKTWNPVTGCVKVSPGCKNCYAERVFPRAYGKVRKFTDVVCHEDRLDQPLHWRKPQRIFVNSMSDLFHEDVSDEFISLVFAAMFCSPQHTFQILTKRPERMLSYLQEMTRDPDSYCYAWAHEQFGASFCSKEIWPLPNVWLGVSVEIQQYADERIPPLMQTLAAVRFVSYEPALGPVDFTKIHHQLAPHSFETFDALYEKDSLNRGRPRPKLDWIIVGGESGPGARSFNVQWARSVIEQCRNSQTPVFVKQMGSNAQTRNDQVADIWYYADGSDMETEDLSADSHRYQGDPVRLLLKDRKGGSMEEWPEDLRIREFPR